MVNKKTKLDKSEKISNDFLLQFAYSIASSIVLLFVYNASLFRYGGGIGSAMPKVLWVLFGIFVLLGSYYICMWRKTDRNGFKITAIYMFVTAVGFFWCVGLQQIPYYLKRFIPSLSYFANTERLMRILFILLGLSVIVEIVVYLLRTKSADGGRTKNS